jgi:hypothetical protein
MTASSTDARSLDPETIRLRKAVYVELIIAGLLVAGVGTYLAWLQELRLRHFRPTKALIHMPMVKNDSPQIAYTAWGPRTFQGRAFDYSYFVQGHLRTAAAIYPLGIETKLYSLDFGEEVWPRLDYLPSDPPGSVETYYAPWNPDNAYLIGQRTFLPYVLILGPFVGCAYGIFLRQKWEYQEIRVGRRTIMFLLLFWHAALLGCAAWYFVSSYPHADRFAIAVCVVLEFLMLLVGGLALPDTERWRRRFHNGAVNAIFGVAMGSLLGLFTGWSVMLICHSLNIWVGGFHWAIYGAAIGVVAGPLAKARNQGARLGAALSKRMAP